MTATLRVVHSTGYRYNGTASSSINEARMVPRTDAEQTLLYSRMEIVPAAWTHRFTDYFGATVVSFEIHEPHEEMQVVATSTVDVTRVPVVSADTQWSQLDDRRFHADFAEYLAMSPLVEPAEDLRELVEAERRTAATPGALAQGALEAVTARMRYLPGQTDVTTRAAQAWDQGYGVCQDLSHVLIGALRAGGVPARYVSGYVAQGVESPNPVGPGAPGGTGQVGEGTSAPGEAGQSHAWVEYWSGRWSAVDPTNPAPVGEQHIAVGHGRDYSDVAPLRGVFSGAATESMFVDVSVTRLR